MRRLAVVLAWPVSLAAQNPPSDTTPRPIRLGEAITLAQRNTPADVQARGNIRTSEAQVRSAWAAFIPNITLSAGSSYQNTGNFNAQTGDRGTSNLPWGASNGLSANVDLFDGLARLNTIRASRANVQAAAAGEVSQRFVTSLNVKQQFYAVLAARESQAAAQSQLDEAQQGMRVSVAKVQAATATKSDSLRSLIQVGNARLALLTAQNDLRSANAALTRLVATPFTVTASPEDTVEEERLSADSAQLLRDAEAGPPVQQAAGQQLLARAQARIARAPYLPTISLGYGLAGNTFDQSFQLFSTDTRYTNQFRLALSYPLFNQLQREQGVVQADVQRDVADANLRDARLAAQQNVVQYLGALRTAEEQVSIARTSVEAAEEDLRVQQQRYALGVSILLDVLTSQAQLTTARAALIQARFNYRVAKAQLSAIVGREL